MIDVGAMPTERVKDTLDWISYLIKKYSVERDDFANGNLNKTYGTNSQAKILAGMIKDLRKLQDIIEENRN